LFCFHLLYAAVQPPAITCVEVLPGNKLKISWAIPPDPLNEFVSYRIHYKTASNYGYSSVLNYNQTSYTQNGINVASEEITIYMTTFYNEGAGDVESSKSIEVKPVYVSINSDVESVATLTWNKLFSPNLSTASDWYYIYKRVSTQAWQLIDSTQYGNENYQDSTKVCADSIFYKIEIRDESGCLSVSKISGEYFVDDFAPNVPVIDSVSVNPSTGHVHVGWTKSPEGDLGGYIVAVFRNNNWEFDTIWSKNSTYFNDILASSFDRPEEYGLLAFDTCWSGNPLSPNTSASGVTHKTIFLNGQINSCERSIKLDWTDYVGWNQGVKNYIILVSTNGGPIKYLTTLSGTKLTYTDTELIPNNNYCYFIRAVSNEGNITSSSNRVCYKLTVANEPTNHYLKQVTVLSDNSIQLAFFVDKEAPVKHYSIERSVDDGMSFVEIAKVNPTNNNDIIYNDNNVDAQNNVYHYRVKVIDICDKVVRISNTSTNIKLNAISDNVSGVNKLFFNFYTGWDTLGSGVSQYNLYRGLTSTTIENEPIAIISPFDNYYEDLLDFETKNDGQICYKIEAIERSGNLLHFKENSLSNITCAEIKPIYYIPSAFTPNGDTRNMSFKPVINFLSSENYSLVIYNRFGKKVFETNSIDEGWYGLNEPIGVYPYILRFQSSSGFVYEVVDSVTLVR
jgi:gliding motility-associated-like protein